MIGASILIRPVLNGILVEFRDGEKTQKIYQNPATEFDGEESCAHYVGLFYDILEFLGDSPSKHRKKNIQITYGEN